MDNKEKPLNGAAVVGPPEPSADAPARPAGGPGAVPDRVALYHDAWGRLVLVDGQGREHAGVEPMRGFPISAPGNGVSLCDAEGREVLWVEDVAALPGPVRAVLEEDLARREFMPVL